jgi:hypothetical protein
MSHPQDIRRRDFLGLLGTGAAALGVLSVAGGALAAAPAQIRMPARPADADNFYASDQVAAWKVRFKESICTTAWT